MKKLIKRFIGDAGTKNLIDRQMWVKDALLSVPKENRILDAGAGEQQFRQYCSHLNYVSQDFNEYEGKGNDEGIQTGEWDVSKTDIISDIIKIPQPDASFDTILCTEVFEHIPDPISALSEFHRLLKSGGEVIISAPFNSLTHFAPYHYCTGFNKYFYEHHLSKLGFTITEITANGDWSEYFSQELRRLLTIYGKAPIYVKILVAFILRFVKLRRRANKTDDLGCFGFHVRAVKL
jgi:ubiquinone/menaquinone biosynthesis C-methylase UbiE